jgi:hypothetical protein
MHKPAPLARALQSVSFQLQAVVVTDASLEESKRINEVCHSHSPPIPFIRVETRGVFASVFCEFGPSFTVYDVDGTLGKISSQSSWASSRLLWHSTAAASAAIFYWWCACSSR